MDNSPWLMEHLMEDQPHEWCNGMVGDRAAGLPGGDGGNAAGEDDGLLRPPLPAMLDADDRGSMVLAAEIVVLAAVSLFLAAGFALGWWLDSASGLQLLKFG